MTTVDELESILNGVQKGKQLKKIAKEDLHYTQKHTERKIKSYFGVGFTTLRDLFFAQIVLNTIHSTPDLTVAATILDMSSQSLSNYCRRHFHSTPTKLKVVEDKKMTEEKSIKEVLLIMAKLPDNTNITLHELGVRRNVIAKMRKAGLPIVSVPGRSGGYNLDKTSRDSCLSWINNWRASRNIGQLTVLF